MKFSLLALCSAATIFGINGNTIISDTSKSCPTSTTIPSTSSNHNDNQNGNDNDNDPLDAALSLRGGEVFEPTTLRDVESTIMKASNEGKLVVIDFSATWCGPCKMISPLYHQLSESAEFENVVFLKVDVDDNPETAAKYQVSAMPTFLFIKRGQVVDKLMGANPAALKSMIEELA